MLGEKIREMAVLNARAAKVMGWRVGDSFMYKDTPAYYDADGKFAGHPGDWYPASSMPFAYQLLKKVCCNKELMHAVAMKMVAALDVPLNSRRAGTARRVLTGLDPELLTRCIVEAYEEQFGVHPATAPEPSEQQTPTPVNEEEKQSR